MTMEISTAHPGLPLSPDMGSTKVVGNVRESCEGDTPKKPRITSFKN